VPLDAIVPNPYQPRGAFADGAIEELARSIGEKGVLQPLLVRRVGDHYELIAGERRWRAAERAGLTHVPVRLREADARESLELALIENLQREDLNPIDEARAYRRLSEEFRLTQDEIAQRVGKSRSAVTNSLRLLALPAEVLAQIESGALSAGHARSLLALPGDERVRAAGEVVRRKLSVRATEKMARARARTTNAAVDERQIESELARALGTRVHLRANGTGAGRIEIEYYTLEQLNGLIARLIDGEPRAAAF
jgi:ParB family chromosome partitioning protein